MGIADIQKKQSEERKREKRLVHFTNAVTREFLESKYVKSKAKTTQEPVDYITKGFLDYLFFTENKEIRELQEEQLNHFMMEFAPRKMTFIHETAKEAAIVLSNFLNFLEDSGHIHNGIEIGTRAKKNAASFAKLFPKTRRKGTVKATTSAKKQTTKKGTPKRKFADTNIGRNDPCPCGSGKKFKKCCGKKT